MKWGLHVLAWQCLHHGTTSQRLPTQEAGSHGGQTTTENNLFPKWGMRFWEWLWLLGQVPHQSPQHKQVRVHGFFFIQKWLSSAHVSEWSSIPYTLLKFVFHPTQPYSILSNPLIPPPVTFSTNSLLPDLFSHLTPPVEQHSHIDNHGWYWITVAKNVGLSWSLSYVLNET